LDDDARQQFSKLSNVTEVYPQIRFITDVRYAGQVGIDFRSRPAGFFALQRRF